MSATLVAHPLNFPSLSLSLPHVPSSVYSLDLVRAPAEGLRWPPPGNSRAGSEGEVGSKVPHQPGRLRDTIPLPNPLRSSRTSPVGSLNRSTRTSPVGSLGHRRNLRDGRAEQGTTRGIEQVKVDLFKRSFQDSLWRKAPSPGSARTARRKLSREDALKSKCCRAVQRGPSIRSTVSRKFSSAGGENSSFHTAPRKISILGRVEFHARLL